LIASLPLPEAIRSLRDPARTDCVSHIMTASEDVAMKGSMHRSDERTRVASHDGTPPPAHPFPALHLSK